MGAAASLAALTLLLATAQSTPDAGYVRSRIPAEKNARRPCLFWSQAEVPFSQSTQGYAGIDDDSEFAAVSRSFATWNAVLASCGNMRFAERARTASRRVGYDSRSGASNENLVLFRSRTCASTVPTGDACYDDDSCPNAYDCWDDDSATIAVTLTTYDLASGVIYDSDIVANATRAEPFTTSDVLVRTDIQNTMTHEVGHLLGLDHASDPRSTMYFEAKSGEKDKRVLDADSSAFVCAVYPQGRPSQSCVQPGPLPAELGPRGGGGCAASAGPLLPVAGLLAWALARTAAARRRREGRA